LESFIVIAVTGFVLGVIMSIPAAGPITVLVISNALKGKLRYSHRVAYGAAVADFIYPFIAVYAFSNLYNFYESFTPYILFFGSALLIIVGLRFFYKNVDFEHLNDDALVYDKDHNKGGFRTGLALNFFNPTLFIGWLVSSFLVINLVSSFGFDTGGLNSQMTHGIEDIQDKEINQQLEERKHALEEVLGNIDSTETVPQTANTHVYIIALSFLYALMVSLGSTLWFYSLGSFVVNKRHLFRTSTINKIIHILGLFLVGVGIYFAVKLVISFI